jgi:flagellar basal-body rod modification protein FlgD
MLDAVSMSMGGLAGSENTTTAARDSLNKTYDQFLVLLTTQLKNQDPLNPMDSKDMTNQLISLAEVEQSIAQTDKLNELIKLNQTSAINSTLLSYVGMLVDYKGNNFTYNGGIGIQFGYTVPADVTSVTTKIYDKDNKLVWSKAGDASEGNHNFVWSGIDSDGKQVAEGRYRLEVTGVNDAGETVAITSPTSDFNYSKAAAQMTLKYNLAAESMDTKISIFDKDGKLVWSTQGAKEAGDHTFTWTGVDNDGKPVPIGSYKVEVGAKDKDDRAVKTSTIVPAMVEGLQVVDGAVMLNIGGQNVPIDTVQAVRLPG